MINRPWEKKKENLSTKKNKAIPRLCFAYVLLAMLFRTSLPRAGDECGSPSFPLGNPPSSRQLLRGLDEQLVRAIWVVLHIRRDDRRAARAYPAEPRKAYKGQNKGAGRSLVHTQQPGAGDFGQESMTRPQETQGFQPDSHPRWPYAHRPSDIEVERIGCADDIFAVVSKTHWLPTCSDSGSSVKLRT